MTHYFFNSDKYEVREEFFPPRGPKWTLEFTRNPQTNATMDTWLTCSKTKIHVPAEISEKLQAMGDEHKTVVSKKCASIEVSQAR